MDTYIKPLAIALALFALSPVNLFASESQDIAALESRAQKGDIEAQYNLGVAYGMGRGVAVNHDKGFYWTSKAAEQGHAEAQCRLGICYEDGLGVAKDKAASVQWYRKSAEQGFNRGQYRLGWAYYNGNGVAKDDVEAYAWFNLSAATYDGAKKYRDEIARELTPEDRVKAQQLSRSLAKAIEEKKQAKQSK